MAAAEVFGIAELLENTILQVALEAVATSSRDRLEPVTSLACLHRVDRTFNATIKGSHKLQGAMFSDSGRVSCSILCSRLQNESHSYTSANIAALRERQQVLRRTIRCSPMEWLWMSVGCDNDFGQVFIDTQKRRKDEVTPKEGLKKFLASKAGSRVASWRRVNVFQSEVAEERMSHAVVYFRRSKGYKGPQHYKEKFKFEDGATLGEIFDKYAEIMGRKLTQHAELAVIAH